MTLYRANCMMTMMMCMPMGMGMIRCVLNSGS